MEGRKIAALLIGLTIAATLLAPIANTVDTNTGVQSVNNESVTANHDTYVDLDGYDLVDGETTVYYDDGTGYVEAAEGSDYELNQSDGSVEALSTGSISDGDQLLVSYDYAATGSTVTTVVGLTPLFIGLLIIGAIAVKIQEMM